MKREDLLQYVPPLKASLDASALTTIAALTGATFDPATADWSKIYTAIPQGASVTTDNVKGLGNMKCLSNYAICAFANCTITFDSNPPVAECGCLSVQGGHTSVSRLNGFPVVDPFSLATVGATLDAKLKAASAKLCSTAGVCAPPTSNSSAAEFISGPVYNTAPFCAEMQPSSNGKPTMYGGKFDLISTFNPFAWGPSDTQGGAQGEPGAGIDCTSTGGSFAYCETAACLLKPSFNGLDTTCYCPVYTLPAGTKFQAAGRGATCGQSVNGKLTFVQNGALGQALN